MPQKDSTTILSDFQNPEFIALYLQECLEDGPDTFLTGLGNVAKANGVTKLADSASVSRASLYKSLREGSNPEFRTVLSVLSALNLQINLAHIEKNSDSAMAA
ncbi:hypothetical protein CCAX7_13210 [Capsulimonas corticalis]|uniref:Uncharacterized protein n=1 Tax=Capsulimonas corticalis TaxID=2219043 RepID=A0A402D4T1_9BACT|nr:addiction module antidote protein [Capsulimonas corticalis]BDI29270.1 hypothetical protein CCAX7_13210 [Capsulimonas corticalis]